MRMKRRRHRRIDAAIDWAWLPKVPLKIEYTPQFARPRGAYAFMNRVNGFDVYWRSHENVSEWMMMDEAGEMRTWSDRGLKDQVIPSAKKHPKWISPATVTLLNYLVDRGFI